MRTIEREELRALLDRDAPVRLVMTLGPTAFAAAHIPGSVTFASIEDGLAALDRDEDIVVYCSHEACASSIQALRLLRQAGFDRVRRYAGGLTDWHAAGLPLAGSGVLGHAGQHTRAA